MGEIRNSLVKSMVLLEGTNVELEALQMHIDEELEVKKYVSEAIKTLIANQLILVNNIFQVQEYIEDGTVVNTLTDILFENELKMQVN